MIITYPSGNTGFVEYKRAFSVWGTFDGADIPKDAVLTVTLTDENGGTVRKITACSMYGACDVYNSALTAYSEERDPGREKLREFGFPELCFEKDVPGSLKNGDIKAWFSKTEFKAVIAGPTDTEHGALFDDGMNYRTKDGEPYSLIPPGDYTLKVALTYCGKVSDSAEKPLTVGKRENQLICRFNPASHKKRMIKWCADMGFAVISDPLPGYLDSYLGDWEYHKGLLKMYRANDLALFETAKVRMFVYRTDKDSTSYATELAFLQSTGAVGDENRFFAYHYDVGEAVLGEGTGDEIKGSPVQFEKDEYLSLCRMDITDKYASDGEYFTDGRHTVRFLCDRENFTVKCGEKFAVMGAMKPWQMDPADFVQKEDNTFEVNNYPEKLIFTVSDGRTEKVYAKKTGLIRHGDGQEESSVFEFYSVFGTDEMKTGKKYRFSVVCIDKYGKETPAKGEFFVNVV